LPTTPSPLAHPLGCVACVGQLAEEGEEQPDKDDDYCPITDAINARQYLFRRSEIAATIIFAVETAYRDIIACTVNLLRVSSKTTLCAADVEYNDFAST